MRGVAPQNAVKQVRPTLGAEAGGRSLGLLFGRGSARPIGSCSRHSSHQTGYSALERPWRRFTRFGPL